MFVFLFWFLAYVQIPVCYYYFIWLLILDAFVFGCFVRVKWDGVLSILDSPTTPILSPEGVVGLMVRNGGAPEMLLPTRNIVKGTWTEAAIVQESLWKAKPAMPFPGLQLLLPRQALALVALSQSWVLLHHPHQLRWWCPVAHLIALPLLLTNSSRTCSLVHLILLQPPPSTGE